MTLPSKSRRQFLSTAAATAAYGVLGTPSSVFAAPQAAKLPWEFSTFTKPLQHLTYDQLAERMAPLGFDGLEIPVRPRGHIEPRAVEEEMPKMVEALGKKNLKLSLFASGINEVSKKQNTEAVLRTAAGLGIERYRLAYYQYDLSQPILPQLSEFKSRLKDVVALSKELGIKPIYQNHSGSSNFGGPIWDLHRVIEDMDPADIGVAFDIAHATIEGGRVWPVNFSLIRPWLDMVFVKEHRWGLERRPAWVPLGTGNVDKNFFPMLLETGFSGPICLHVEYVRGRSLDAEKAYIEATRNDFAILRESLGA